MYMFMPYNLPTKQHDCLNNAVNKQLSTHFDLKIYILIMQLPIFYVGWNYVYITKVTLIIPIG